ncbi:MAG: DegT/DnrJ/EryC1/StrS aminotransferase family protein [Deltaproteobacteria bacterium]|nr:DegT/DnrJ/EryC1/StrS aminotransferase family protein [Deltaproteobacteria bacterium]
MNKMLPFSKPSIGTREVQEVFKTLTSGWLTTGKKVNLFETKFAEWVGARFAVATSSATAALHISLQALGIGEKDEIMTPSFTFISTVNIITLLGAKPIFVDIHPETWNLDESLIEKKITSKTKAIIPMHYAGRACQMKPIYEVAKKYGLKVIDDAAHALGTYDDGKHIGSGSDLAIYSFHPNKNITTGEGGMIVSNDEAFIEKLRPYAFHGILREAWKRTQAKHLAYDVEAPGFKYNMMDLQASLGLHQLDRLPVFLKKRKRLSRLYERFLKNDPNLLLQEGGEWGNHSRNLFPVVLKTERIQKSREEIMEALKQENISVGVHWPAAHTCTYYRENLKNKDKLPHTEYVASRVISLPLFPDLKATEVNRVCKTLKKIVGSVSRERVA